jgi:hypothetical protein
VSLDSRTLSPSIVFIHAGKISADPLLRDTNAPPSSHVLSVSYCCPSHSLKQPQPDPSGLSDRAKAPGNSTSSASQSHHFAQSGSRGETRGGPGSARSSCGFVLIPVLRITSASTQVLTLAAALIPVKHLEKTPMVRILEGCWFPALEVGSVRAPSEPVKRALRVRVHRPIS